ncbi:Uncharacterized protein dnm_088670 [Desulfonema magnum]|uniref:Uncharacterized protein n=1 Tax=Desulfonema magnum TaxID=45655 RepID=A0A975BWH2_9BACT|nr:Uncharacterized protein dnm_088670 [Desulfonema magnum]
MGIYQNPPPYIIKFQQIYLPDEVCNPVRKGSLQDRPSEIFIVFYKTIFFTVQALQPRP